MEIKSKLENITIKKELLTIHLSLKDRDNVVKLLKSISKRDKLDRLDSYILDSLIQALENPEVKVEPIPNAGLRVPDAKMPAPVEVVPEDIDPVKIIAEVKRRLDPRNEKTIAQFIKESIDFAQTQLGIKTIPDSSSEEDFYLWLISSNIINKDGSPKRNQ